MSVRLSWYPMWMRWLPVTVMRVLFMLHLCTLRERERVMAMLVWGMKEVSAGGTRGSGIADVLRMSSAWEEELECARCVCVWFGAAWDECG